VSEIGERGLEQKSRMPRTQSSSPVSLHRAGFWIRLAAAVIDFLVLAIPLPIFVLFLSLATGNWQIDQQSRFRSGLDQGGFQFLSVILVLLVITAWLYFAFLESSSWRGTIGKRVLGLCVSDINGDLIGFWQASLRFFAGHFLIYVPCVGIYCFMADCLCIGLIPGRRAIHDILAGCLVMREDTIQYGRSLRCE